MANQPSSPSIPSTLPDIPALISTWAGNFQRNTVTAFADLRPKDYIRLVIIIGAYCLLRPYLLKLGAKVQAKEHEKPVDFEAGNTKSVRGAIKALRGESTNGAASGSKVTIPGVDSDSDEDEGDAGPGDWGKKARVRQRRMIRMKLEEHERRLREMEETASDKEIEEFLIKD